MWKAISRAGAPACKQATLIASRSTRSPTYVAKRSASLFKFSGGTQEIEAASAADMIARIKTIHEKTLLPLNSKLLGPLDKSSDEMIPMPMVFLLGNHSSGKSTFVNYLIGRKVQTTGVAPTDDAFTIIAPGTADVDQDGPSLIGDADLGFGGLRQIGFDLMNKLQLKIRKDVKLQNIMLVDSPGMIDSPVAPTVLDPAARAKDRGYNFAAVVKWFAERADVILLFQDPEKPGTTGETMHILTTALKGQDYKMFIILNKADQVATVLDFARAYGALCWNIAKVMSHRKDLPRIYTMCVPVSQAAEQKVASGPLKDALPDLEGARSEIVAEVMRAPLRRVDNLVTRLYDSANLLKLHAEVMNAVKKEYFSEIVRSYGMVAAAATGLGSVAGTLLVSGVWEIGAPLAGLTVAGAAFGSWYARKLLSDKMDYYLADGAPGLTETFRRIHYRQIQEDDEYLKQLWERVEPSIRSCLRTLGFRGVHTVRKAEFQALDDIINNQIPALRKLATKAGALPLHPQDATTTSNAQ